MERDVHYRRAKSEGYRARSAYKLLEIFERFGSLSEAQTVVDLCAAPGSWSQVLSQRLSNASIVAVDLQDIEPVGNVRIIKGDITSQAVADEIKNILKRKADLIVCDGAPEVTGLHDMDEYFQSSLIQASCAMCREFLGDAGVFITKVFTGETPKHVIEELEEFFEEVTVFKPKSSRIESREAFAVCNGMKMC